MESTVSNALFLLAVGMITVFIILLLVILCGRLLIYTVNKYFPEKEKVSSVNSEERTREILQQIVNKITDSKGTIEKVEKL